MTAEIRKAKAIITTPGVNEYDDILGQLDEQKGARASRSIYSAADVNPDQESALVKISRRSGVPVEALRLDNGAEARRRVAVKEAENLAGVAPVTANWLTNPENARVAHDDLEKLAELERVARNGFGMKAPGGSTMGIATETDQATAARAKTIGSAFVRGLSASPATFNAGMAGTGEMIADFVDWSLQAFPDDTGMRKRVADVARESRQYWQDQAKSIMGGEEKPGSAESYFQQAGNSIGTSLLAAPFGMAGEGSALTMFALSADGNYGEMRDKGISVPVAAALATSNKAMEGLTEKIGLDQLYKGSAPVVKKALGFLLGDLAGEEINTLYSAIADKVTIKPDMTMGDVVQQVIDTAIVTSIAGGAQGVTMHGAAKASETLFDQYQARQEARRQSDFLLALGDSVKATKTFGRLPSAVQDLVKEIKQGGPVQDVFVPVERFTELFQSEGMDPGKAAEQILSDPSRYFEAVATGGDVAIPLEEFARLADAPFYKELVKDARTSLAGMTAREAEAFGKGGEDHINALLAQAAEEAPAEHDATYSDAYQKIFDDTFGQLVGVNVSPGEAEANAALRAKGLATIAQRYGFTPEALLERFPLKVTRGDLPAALQRQASFSEQQQGAQLSAMLDAIRSGKGASPVEMFGPSLGEFLREKGVKDDRGDLAAMDVDKGIKFKKKMLRENGLSLDKAREAAAEAGYLPAESTVSDFLDLVDKELRGSPTYAPGNMNQSLVDQQQAHDELAQWLDMMGVDLGQAGNDDVIKMMQEAVAGETLDQSAWHGSPHTFGKFTTSAIGTGEGAQAYGHGLYFAGKKEVAEFYRDTLSRQRQGRSLSDQVEAITVDGDPLLKKFPVEADRKLVDLVKDGDKWDVWFYADERRASWEDLAKDETYPHKEYAAEKAKAWADLAAAIEGGAEISTKEKGRLYAVELAPKEDEYLLWDRPLSEQSETVKAALENLADDYGFDVNEVAKADAKYSGRDAYRYLESTIAAEGLNQGRTASAAASDLLHSLGIRGVKYLDGTSRDKVGYRITWENGLTGWESEKSTAEQVASTFEKKHGKATITFDDEKADYNFVVFSDDDVAITQMFQAKPAGSLDNVLDQLRERFPDMKLDVYETRGVITISRIVFPKDQRGKGQGSEVFDALTRYADATGQILAATPSTDFGGTKSRIVAFNKRFGFVENKGRNKDFAISETMYRLPKKGAQLDQAKRGYIKILESMPGFEIALLKNADASTFIHELGHYYEEILGRLADQEDAPDQLKADYASILKWLGAESKGALTVEQREKFARGFEAYLYEGNAPSQELRGVFQRFKTWLKAVYSSLKSLNVELTDEVRGVFDRLLATDDEIAAAEHEARAGAMYATAEDAGMSPAVFEAYRQLAERAHEEAKDRLERAKLKEAKRAHEAWWKEARGKMAEEVEAEAKKDPVFEAIHFLKTGRLFDGSPFQGDVFKLSGAELARAYDAPTVKAIRRKLGNVVTKEGGLSLAMVAEMFGFSSGDEMVKRMMEAPKLKDFIKAETDRRMMEVHGTMTGAEIAEEALNSVFNDDQAKLLREELRAIRRKARDVKPYVDAAVGEVRGELRREKAERAYERRWMEAERRLAVAIEKGAKQAEIDELKASIKADKERQKAAREFAKSEIPPVEFFKEAARRHVAGLKVAEILPGKFSQAEAKAARQAFELNGKGRYDEAAAAKIRQLLNHYLYREAVAAKKEADRIASMMRRLQTSKAQAQIGKAGADYLDQVNALLERYEFKKKSGKVLAERERLLAWVERMEERNGFPPPIPASVLEDALEVNYRTLTMSELRDVSDAVKAITFLARMDGKIQRAQEIKDIHELAVEAAESIEANSKGPRPRLPEKSLPQDVPGKLVDNYFASHRKMSSLARQMDGGQDGGVVWNLLIRPMNEAGDREAAMRAEAAGRLAEIFGVYSGIERTKMHLREFIPEINTSLSKWGRIVVALNMGNEGNLQRLGATFSSRDQLDAVVDALDERDWQFVQAVWDYLDSFWPEIEAKEKRVNGVAPQRVEHTPVQTKFGTLPGGYWPIKYDREESAKAGAHAEQEILKQMMGGAFTRATTQRGHTEARLEAVNRPLQLSIDILFQHLNQVIHDLTHHEMLLNVGKLLGASDLQEAIRDHYGMETYKVFTDGLRDVAIGDIPAQDAFEKFMNYTRIGISTAGLGWNLVTSMMQPLGLTQSTVRIGAKWVAKGVGRWIGSPSRMIETTDWIYSKSPFMQTRALTQTREIAEIRNQMTVGVIPHAVRDSFFYLIQQLQKVVDIPTWLGQYEKSMAAHGNEADAIAEADQAVIDAQAHGQIKDLARIQRGGPLKKMFTTFYSYFSTTYNLAAESRARTHFKNPSEVGRFLVDMLLLYTVPVVLTTLLKEGIQRAIGGGGDDDEFLKTLMGEQLGYLTGGFIGLREFGALFSGFQGYEGPAGSRFYSETSKLAKEISQGEWDEGLFKRLNSVGGILFHYPATQIQRTVQGMQELADGRGNLLSLLFGKPRK